MSVQMAVLAVAGLSVALACQPQGSQVPLADATPADRFPVTYDRLVNADDEPGNWLMYSGQYSGQRYSRLDEIDRSNVDQLELAWIYQLETLSWVESTPLVINGLMFVTQSPSTLIAMDAATGRPFWTYEPELSDRLTLCCGDNNRGVAVLGDRVFLGTVDARLIALDANSGNVIWETQVDRSDGGYSITGAPLVVKDMVVVGIGGGEYGVRGYVDAYSAETGERVWRTYTIPGEGEPGNETWEGDSWQTGGAPTWLTGSYDPELNLIYWGTGNPGPDWNGEDREGDNLCSDCVLALDADDGEIVWQFQFTPHDVHDWDATQIPVLVDAEYGGELRKLMLWANRNAFYYVLDRETGEFLHAQSYALQTWAERIDELGRPVRVPGLFPSEEGVVVSPPIVGATNWWSPSYSPKTGLFYVTAYDGAQRYFIGEAEYREGQPFLGGAGQEELPEDKYHSAIRALDGPTGEVVWEFATMPMSTSGILSTAGDLVFAGSREGYFFALDAETGESLWNLNVGGRVHAAPITYRIEGRQFVTVVANHAMFTFRLRG